MKKIFYLLLFIGFLTSCKTTKKEQNVLAIKETSNVKTKSIELIGVIKKQGITTYQYGTHILKGNKNYALKSKTIILDNYLEKRVKIIGKAVSGYPIEGGPLYIDVINIEIL